MNGNMLLDDKLGSNFLYIYNFERERLLRDTFAFCQFARGSWYPPVIQLFMGQVITSLYNTSLLNHIMRYILKLCAQK